MLVLEKTVPNTNHRGKGKQIEIMSFEKGKAKQLEEVDVFGDEFEDDSDKDLLKAVNNGLNQLFSKSKAIIERATIPTQGTSYLFNVDDLEVNVPTKPELD